MSKVDKMSVLKREIAIFEKMQEFVMADFLAKRRGCFVDIDKFARDCNAFFKEQGIYVIANPNYKKGCVDFEKYEREVKISVDINDKEE